MRLNTWTWIVWLITSLIVISSTRNPLYLGLILLIQLFTYYALLGSTAGQQAFVSPLKFTVFIVLTAALFNAIISHFGATVLFVIPGRLPLISGPVTLEALVYGAINGLVLSTMLVTFSVLNSALPVRALIHLIPQAFYPVAIVTSIALTFLPATSRQLEQIREAQAIRGHQLKGLRDWLPMVMPLLVGGLERAMQLSETMTARGFASSDEGLIKPKYRLVMLAGLSLVVVGWLVTLSPKVGNLGFILVGLGFAITFVGLWRVSKLTPRTSYKRETWSWEDGLVITGCMFTLAGYLLPLPALDQQVLIYNPYPEIGLPGFDALIGLASLGLLAPAILVLLKKP